MTIVKWAAIGVTLLMGLANFGLIAQDLNIGGKILGVVLALAALVAIVGVIARKGWGVPAVIAVGAFNLVGAIIAAVAGMDGWPIGAVLSALGIIFGVVYRTDSRPAVAA
ncbi:hypothetical protein [Aeromicrobium sp.]|uniref:hypothetical protein n=1 Tax=Aeromicrobium sp. TaxID=1871063 RepID=UPI003C511AC9